MKKIVLFASSIALVIALAATSVLAANKTTETGNANTGKVDGRIEDTTETDKVDDKVLATDSGDLNKALPNGNAKRIDETLEPNEESNALNAKITPEAEEAPKQDEESKIGEKEYTIGTLADFGVTTPHMDSTDDFLFIPLSEYPYLNDELKFLADYNIYCGAYYIEEFTPEQVNSYLQGFVDRALIRITRDGCHEFIAGYGFTLNNFMGNQIFDAVYDHYGYSK